MIEYAKIEHRKAYIYKYIQVYMSRKIKLEKGKLNIQDEIIALYEKVITKFGSGAKIDAPKEFLGKRVYILIRK